jgi:hypothetical protein
MRDFGNRVVSRDNPFEVAPHRAPRHSVPISGSDVNTSSMTGKAMILFSPKRGKEREIFDWGFGR